MSGGYFEYEQYKINQIADQVEQLIRSNDDSTLNEWGDRRGRHYNVATIEAFKRGLRLLNEAAIYAQRIDWLVSGDDGENTFLERLEHDLAELDPAEIDLRTPPGCSSPGTAGSLDQT